MLEDWMGSDELRSKNDLLPDDEIVAEVRAIRRQLGAAVGFDLDRMYEQLKAIESEEREKGRAILAVVPPSGR
jgi:hypothetical protein